MTTYTVPKYNNIQAVFGSASYTPFDGNAIEASFEDPQEVSTVSDVTNSGWNSTAANLHSALSINDATDADYIYAQTEGATAEVAVGALFDPSSPDNHVIEYTLQPGFGAVSVQLRQGTTTLASWGPHLMTGEEQTFFQTLTTSEANSITDYSALRVRFVA